MNLLKRKISLLKHMKYIAGSTITLKAHLAAKVYSFELQIAELFEMGFFDGLDELTLFRVMSALV